MSRRNNAKGIMIVLILCFATLLLAGFKGEGGKAGQAGGFNKSLTLLTSLGKSVTTPGTPLRLVVKWQGEYRGREAGMAATHLSSKLGLGEVDREEGGEHVSYRASTRSHGYTTHMFWSELGEGHSYVIVTLETADLLNAPDLQAAANEAGMELQESGITADWNTSLQGASKEQGDSQQAMLFIEKNMKMQLKGLAEKESYEDATTVSHSYDSSALLRSVSSGNHNVAIQTAIHQDVNTGSSRITIGLPLITIEY